MTLKPFLVPIVAFMALSSFAQKEYRMPYPEPCAEPDKAGKPNMQLSAKKFGYFNQTKDDGSFVLIINYSYDDARPFSKITGYATAKIGDLWGIINVDGSPLVPFIYDAIDGPNEDGYYTINLEGKWGVLDKSGLVTVTCKYDTMSDLYDGWYEVSEGDTWGYVHRSGAYAASYSEMEKKKANLEE